MEMEMEMEMETTGTVPPIASELTVEENDALASQVMELIGGITGACRTPEEPTEEKELWSLEEGDDSVFYSDEEQAHQDLRDAALSTLGANVSRRLANSVADDEPAQHMEEDDVAEKTSQDRKEAMQMAIWTEGTQRKFEAPKTEEVISVIVEGGAEFQESCGELDSKRPPEQNGAAEKVNQQIEEDVRDAQACRDAADVSHIQSHERMIGGAKALKPLKLSNRQLDRDREGEDRDFHANAGFHQNHSPHYFTLPLMKKPAHSVSQQKTFNHLSSSKYSTTSYRRIRRGNTRQKIEEFEFIMKNQ